MLRESQCARGICLLLCTFEELAHGQIVQSVRAVCHHALHSKQGRLSPLNVLRGLNTSATRGNMELRVGV